MEKFYENIRKYGETMKGKFSDNPSGNGIVISVTHPFVKEIHIECDGDIYNDYLNTYRLLQPQAEHPQADHWKIYYNTQEKCYYRSEWQLINPTPEGAQWGYVWVRTDIQYIVEHAQKFEKLQAHFRSYRSIHKGQLCVFTGYAIDPNGQCKRPSTVESMFHRHKWFYHPFSFKVALLDENTIDDFVEETRISKEMTQKMVLYHREQDEIKLQKEKDDRNKKEKEKWETRLRKINDHFKTYQYFYKYGVGIGILGSLISLIQLAIKIFVG